MKLNELNQYQDPNVSTLGELFQATGNCPMNGYLGESLERIAYDEEGNFYYSTEHSEEDFFTQSRGVVYGKNLLVKQKSKSQDSESYSLYSWDTEKRMYTYLAFDYPAALKRFFDTIKNFRVNLCDEDVSHLFQEMGLTFENVTQIRLNQSVSPLDVMFREQDKDGNDPFVR